MDSGRQSRCCSTPSTLLFFFQSSSRFSLRRRSDIAGFCCWRRAIIFMRPGRLRISGSSWPARSWTTWRASGWESRNPERPGVPTFSSVWWSTWGFYSRSSISTSSSGQQRLPWRAWALAGRPRSWTCCSPSASASTRSRPSRTRSTCIEESRNRSTT